MRPEQLRIAARGGPGAAKGNVVAATYYGHDASVVVSLDEGARQVSARVAGHMAPERRRRGVAQRRRSGDGLSARAFSRSGPAPAFGAASRIADGSKNGVCRDDQGKSTMQRISRHVESRPAQSDPRGRASRFRPAAGGGARRSASPELPRHNPSPDDADLDRAGQRRPEPLCDRRRARVGWERSRRTTC